MLCNKSMNYRLNRQIKLAKPFASPPPLWWEGVWKKGMNFEFQLVSSLFSLWVQTIGLNCSSSGWIIKQSWWHRCRGTCKGGFISCFFWHKCTRSCSKHQAFSLWNQITSKRSCKVASFCQLLFLCTEQGSLTVILLQFIDIFTSFINQNKVSL